MSARVSRRLPRRDRRRSSRSSCARATRCSGRSITSRCCRRTRSSDWTRFPAANQDAAFFVRRAGLAAGGWSARAARADLDQAQKLDPGSGDAYALRAIVAVALNDKTQALENGRRAVRARAELHVCAVSPVLCAAGGLSAGGSQGRRLSGCVERARNAAAWARLAELRLMLDDVGAAEDAARARSQAGSGVSPSARRARVHTARETEHSRRGAHVRTSNQPAVERSAWPPRARPRADSARAPRGGPRRAGDSGRAQSRERHRPQLSRKGVLRREARYAGRPAVRVSEGHRSPRSDIVVYDAIRLQTVNRPVEALTNAQQAIRLNDNRAVYRSRLPAAMRTMRVEEHDSGRVYRDLGFEELALVEGWKSVAADPANHSAHRLLADNYLVLPRHEIAESANCCRRNCCSH